MCTRSIGTTHTIDCDQTLNNHTTFGGHEVVVPYVYVYVYVVPVPPSGGTGTKYALEGLSHFNDVTLDVQANMHIVHC